MQKTIEALYDWLECLDGIQRFAVYLRFWCDLTEAQIGELLFGDLENVSLSERRSRAHDVLRAALRKLRRRAGVA